MALALGLSALSFSAPQMGLQTAVPTRTTAVEMKAPQWAQPAMAGLLSAAVALTPFSAEAARSGGRVGGRAPSSSMRSAPRSAPAPVRTTNVYVAPTPMMGGYGMGYGGYGMGGGNGMGLYLGLSLAETFMREQQRQAYLQQQLR